MKQEAAMELFIMDDFGASSGWLMAWIAATEYLVSGLHGVESMKGGVAGQGGGLER